jgi:hypothetical protein
MQSIAAGANHTVGLKSDGTVLAKGSNVKAQCSVSSWTGIKEIAAGAYHTVGLRDNGSVVAIGDPTENRTDVLFWTNITDVAAGYYHTVGLRSDGTVVATPAPGPTYDHGQCNVSTWTDITAIACGLYTTFGLKSDGTVVATGWNNNGETNVSSWTNITAIAGGGFHTVGLKGDGTVVATGLNDDNQTDVSSWTSIGPTTIGTLGDTDGYQVGLRLYSGNDMLVLLPYSLTSLADLLLPGQSVKFAVRTSSDGIIWSELRGRDGSPINWTTGSGNYLGQADTDVLPFTEISGIAAAPYIDIVARLESGIMNTPVLSSVTLAYAGQSLDPVNPAGTIIVNDRAAFTNDPVVSLSLFAGGSDTVVSEMRFSNDGTTWLDDWETYATTRVGWDMTDAAHGGTADDGVKTVYAQFRDTEGHVSPSSTDTILLDTTAPDGTVTINGGDPTTVVETVDLALTATDAGTGPSQMRFSNDGTDGHWSDWETYNASKSGWDITSTTYGGNTGVGVKTVYARFRDAAGNESTAATDTVTFDPGAFEFPVYRFYKFLDGAHFYTISESERGEVAARPDIYRYEDISFHAYSIQVPGTLPVHRFYNFLQGVHFYTINQAEASYVNDTAGWTFRYEGVAYYAYPTQAPNTVPVHRFYNFLRGVHFFTANQAEASYINDTAGWTYRYEGIAYYLPQ